MTRPSAGYEMPDDDAVQEPIFFELEHYPAQHTSTGVNARLMRGSEPIGMIHCRDMKELYWLRQRINGTYDPMKYDVGILDPI